MLKGYLLLLFYFFHTVSISQTGGNRTITVVRDSILKLKHKQLIKFTFDNSGSKEYAFIFKDKKKWNGIFLYDNSNRSRRTDQSDDIRVKKFHADIVLSKLDSLGVFCLKSISTQSLSEAYNSQMQKTKNSNVIYELPTCHTGTLVTIEVKNVTVSMVNCWYEIVELKTIPEVNRFSKISSFIIKEVHKLY